MLIKLTSDEWQVLQEVLVEVGNAPCLDSSGEQSVINVSEETADEYRNLVQEEFELKGMDESYEPTSRGQILESLIDKLFTG